MSTIVYIFSQPRYDDFRVTTSGFTKQTKEFVHSILYLLFKACSSENSYFIHCKGGGGDVEWPLGKNFIYIIVKVTEFFEGKTEKKKKACTPCCPFFFIASHYIMDNIGQTVGMFYPMSLRNCKQKKLHSFIYPIINPS